MLIEIAAAAVATAAATYSVDIAANQPHSLRLIEKRLTPVPTLKQFRPDEVLQEERKNTVT